MGWRRVMRVPVLGGCGGQIQTEQGGEEDALTFH
jgi:hypothetical protein